MTPKEKAQELIDKFIPHSSGNSNNNEAKQCALIAVDEIINFGNQSGIRESMMYWNKVKQEIKDL